MINQIRSNQTVKVVLTVKNWGTMSILLQKKSNIKKTKKVRFKGNLSLLTSHCKLRGISHLKQPKIHALNDLSIGSSRYIQLAEQEKMSFKNSLFKAYVK